MRIAIAFIFVVLFMLTCMGLNPARAAELDIKGSAFQGVTDEGFSYTRSELLVVKPDDAPDLFGLFPDYGLYEVTLVDGNIILDRGLFTYKLGDSNNFTGEAYVDGDESAIGFGYCPEHWAKWMECMHFKAFVREGGRYTFNGTLDYEFTPGYGVYADGWAYLDDNFDNQAVDGRICMWHNLNPTGELWAEAGYHNIGDAEYVYFGVGGYVD